MIAAVSEEVGVLPLSPALDQEKSISNLSLLTWDSAYFWKLDKN